MPEPSTCQVCYTCEKGVVTTVTVDDIKKNGGKIRPEWADEETRARCQSCYECQNCVTSQQG